MFDPRLDDALSALKRLQQDVELLKRSGAGRSASVSKGRTRFVGVESLVVEGSQQVSGALNVDGTLTVAGTESVTGTLVIGGAEIVNGQLIIHGTLAIDGETTMSGDTTLTGDLVVNGGGQILVDGSTDMTIGTVTDGRAGIDFGIGELSSNGNDIGLRAGDSWVGAASNAAVLGSAGKRLLVGSDGGFYYDGLTTAPSGTATSYLVVTASGRVYRGGPTGVAT